MIHALADQKLLWVFSTLALEQQVMNQSHHVMLVNQISYYFVW